MADYPQVAARRAHAAAHAPEAHARDTDAAESLRPSRTLALRDTDASGSLRPSRTLATRDTDAAGSLCPLRTLALRDTDAAGSLCPSRTLALRGTDASRSRCAPRVRSRSAARMRAGAAATLAYARDADAPEECTHAAPAESMRSSVRRRRGCFRRMHACRACRVDALQRTSATRMLPKNAGMRRSRVLSCKLRFDAAEPRALDCPSLARRRTPSPLIPSPIYGIIYEFSDFWAQFWTIFKSTRPPSKS